MKTNMRNHGEAAVLQEWRQKQLESTSARNARADRLVEEWSHIQNIGEGLQESFDKNPNAIRNTAIVLENTAREFKNLTETQVSSAYAGLTPENALRVVRLGYPNSNRGVVFHEAAMESANDGIWYLSPVYSTTKRDATAGIVTHEDDSYRYAGNEEIESVTGTINGVNKVFTGGTGGNLGNPPVKPFHFRVYENNVIIAQDDGAGNVVGAKLDSASTNTINYESGAVTITYDTAPAVGTTIQFGYVFDYEDSGQYTDLGEVELKLSRVIFDLRRYSLGLSWSKQSELVLGTTLNIDAEEALVKGASEELKKALDYEAFRLGYRTALSNASPRNFDADFLSAGADSAKAHAQSLHRVFEDTADDMRASINRGGYTSIVAGAQFANYMATYMDKFSEAGAEREIGIYRIGTYGGNKPVIKVPNTTIVPTNEAYVVWNNEESGDYAIGFMTLLPMYMTDKLEYKSFNSERGLAEFGDHRVLNSKYIRRITASNLDRY